MYVLSLIDKDKLFSTMVVPVDTVPSRLWKWALFLALASSHCLFLLRTLLSSFILRCWPWVIADVCLTIGVGVCPHVQDAAWVRMSHIRGPAKCESGSAPDFSFLLISALELVVMAYILGSLPPVWWKQVEFPAPDCSLFHPCLRRASEEVILSVSLSFPASQINKI